MNAFMRQGLTRDKAWCYSQVIGQMLSERPTREASDQDAEHRERVVVAPALSGLEGERELGQPGEPLVGAERDGIWPCLRAVVRHRLLQRRITELHAVAGAHGQ